MDKAMGRPTTECIEIDHPWISNDLMPLYRWTFPSEATDEELSAWGIANSKALSAL
jgi:hypothetical protein